MQNDTTEETIQTASGACPREENKRSARFAAMKAAFPYTIPVFAGYWFLGLAYGVYMNVSGFSVWYPALMSLSIFGGSLEFVAVSMLLAPFAPIQALVITLLIQARHIFYGISMLDRFKGMGWKKPYLIFGMTDETFSVLYAAETPKGIDKGRFMLFVTLFNHLYWFTGSTIGGILGSFVKFSTKGLDFVLTAMFVTIFLGQLSKEKKPYTAIVGLTATAACRLIFGLDTFMVAAMVCIFLVLTIWRKPLERSLTE